MLSMVVHICIPSTGGEGTWTQRPEYSVQGQPARHSKTMSQEKNKQNPLHNNKSKSFRRYTQTTAPFLGSHSQRLSLQAVVLQAQSRTTSGRLTGKHRPQPLLTVGGLVLRQPTVTLTLGPETSHVSTGASPHQTHV